MPDEGDRGIVFSSGSPFSSFVEVAPAQVGDKVVLYNLSNGDRLAVPSLDLLLGGQVWVTPSFDFAGFDWRIDFDFLLIPLELGAGYYTIRYLGDDYIQDNVKGNWVVDSQIGKYVHIVAGANADRYYEIIDNGTDWITLNQDAYGLVNGDLSIDLTTNWRTAVGFRGTATLYGTGGKSHGYGYVIGGVWSWNGCTNYIYFGKDYPISVGSTVSFWYMKSGESPGYVGYNAPGHYNINIEELPPTAVWTKHTITMPETGEIFIAGVGWFPASPGECRVCNFSSPNFATMAQMGFALGNLFEIVDTIP